MRGTVRLPIERYTCAEVEIDGSEQVIGLEHRDGDDLEKIRGRLRAFVRGAWEVALARRSRGEPTDDAWVAALIKDQLAFSYPDRAFYFEIGHDGWFQVYQPWGLPRNDAVVEHVEVKAKDPDRWVAELDAKVKTGELRARELIVCVQDPRIADRACDCRACRHRRGET